MGVAVAESQQSGEIGAPLEYHRATTFGPHVIVKGDVS